MKTPHERIVDRLQSALSFNPGASVKNLYRDALMQLEMNQSTITNYKSAYKVVCQTPEGKHIALIKNLSAKIARQKLVIKASRREYEITTNALSECRQLAIIMRKDRKPLEVLFKEVRKTAKKGNILRVLALLEDFKYG